MSRPYTPRPLDRALDGQQFLSTIKLLRRYGVSHMWPERQLVRDPGFPRPVYICGRRFWRLDELIAWEATLSRRREPSRSAAANAGNARGPPPFPDKGRDEAQPCADRA